MALLIHRNIHISIIFIFWSCLLHNILYHSTSLFSPHFCRIYRCLPPIIVPTIKYLPTGIAIFFLAYRFVPQICDRSVFEFSHAGKIFCCWTTKRKQNIKFVRLKSSNMNSRINGSATWWPVRGGTILGWTRVSPDTSSISPPKWYNPIEYNSNGLSRFA